MSRGAFDACIQCGQLLFCVWLCNRICTPRYVIVNNQARVPSQGAANGAAEATTDGEANGETTAVFNQILEREQIEVLASHGSILPLLTIHKSQ
jgi:hypothetical protein